MRVLITQPAQDAAATAAALRARGHEVVAAPVLTAARLPDPKINLSAAQGFVVTGGEGARALADTVGVRTFPVFTDSDATASEAASAFDNRADARRADRSPKPGPETGDRSMVVNPQTGGESPPSQNLRNRCQHCGTAAPNVAEAGQAQKNQRVMPAIPVMNRAFRLRRSARFRCRERFPGPPPPPASTPLRRISARFRPASARP